MDIQKGGTPTKDYLSYTRALFPPVVRIVALECFVKLVFARYVAVTGAKDSLTNSLPTRISRVDLGNLNPGTTSGLQPQAKSNTRDSIGGASVSAAGGMDSGTANVNVALAISAVCDSIASDPNRVVKRRAGIDLV